MNEAFGAYLRKRREELLKRNPDFTVRKLAAKLGIQPSYISKVEREEVPPPSEATIIRLAEALQENPDILMAMAGKVSADLRAVIVKRPKLFADLIRQLKDAPDHAVLRVVREVRDGNW
jgi:transcriptional regulator with XRE-family HTH domain